MQRTNEFKMHTKGSSKSGARTAVLGGNLEWKEHTAKFLAVFVLCKTVWGTTTVVVVLNVLVTMDQRIKSKMKGKQCRFTYIVVYLP